MLDGEEVDEEADEVSEEDEYVFSIQKTPTFMLMYNIASRVTLGRLGSLTRVTLKTPSELDVSFFVEWVSVRIGCFSVVEVPQTEGGEVSFLPNSL